ncbi:MAG TPA: Lpg1974 family pore-forming outer membrane protein [Nitrospinota bacterium]|nr:Lpg1974 family pore-forming outer membrane protein [Nitrospinota bacterium]
MKKVTVLVLSLFMIFLILGFTGSFAQAEEEDLRKVIERLETQIKENQQKLEDLKRRMSEQEKVKEEVKAVVEVPKKADDTGLFFDAKVLLLTPRGNDIDVAISDSNTNNWPEGSARGIEFDTFSTVSGKYTLGYQFENNSRLSSSYWRFDADEDFSITKPSGGTLWALLNSPDAGFEKADSASAHLDYELDVIDLEYTRPLFQSGKLTTSGLIGLRYARIDQDLSATYKEGPNTDRVTSDIETNMFGPKVGVMGKRSFFNDKFYFQVDGAISLLVGHTDAKYKDIYNIITLKDTSSEYESVFPVYELDIGLGWTPIPDLEFRLGYLISYWTDVLTQKNFVDDVHDAKAVDEGDSVTFDGIVFSVKYVF